MVSRQGVPVLARSEDDVLLFKSISQASRYLAINPGIVKMAAEGLNHCRSGISRADRRRYTFQYRSAAPEEVPTKDLTGWVFPRGAYATTARRFPVVRPSCARDPLRPSALDDRVAWNPAREAFQVTYCPNNRNNVTRYFATEAEAHAFMRRFSLYRMLMLIAGRAHAPPPAART